MAAPDARVSPHLAAALARLPEVQGLPIRLAFQPALIAYREKLFSNAPRGEAVHAGSFLRERRMVLDTSLLREPDELTRILVHEVFHFVWVRLGNPRRCSFRELLQAELRLRARGELGWSAELRKNRLAPGDAAGSTRRWREYCCESFCDTAAWLFSGLDQHPEFTLADRFRRKRQNWFRNELPEPIFI